MKVVALAGGVGGAKLADGLARRLGPDELTIVVNTGDDFEHLGLSISPDLDTVCYTLANLANPETGWGLKEESWQAFDALQRLGGPAWFHLGDRDLGTHLERTRRLKLGESLSAITRDFCRVWGILHPVLPMTDQPVHTCVSTKTDGELAFQDYFVRLQCHPVVSGFRFDGAELSRPAPGVLQAIHAADVVIVCPSNPWVSIGPILAVPGIREEISSRVVVALSPIIGGKSVKGPAAKMYAELGIQPSAKAVVVHYRSFLRGFVLDNLDQSQGLEIATWGIIIRATATVMSTPADRERLAAEILGLCDEILNRE